MYSHCDNISSLRSYSHSLAFFLISCSFFSNYKKISIKWKPTFCYRRFRVLLGYSCAYACAGARSSCLVMTSILVAFCFSYLSFFPCCSNLYFLITQLAVPYLLNLPYLTFLFPLVSSSLFVSSTASLCCPFFFSLQSSSKKERGKQKNTKNAHRKVYMH